jgi:hypothetical protein
MMTSLVKNIYSTMYTDRFDVIRYEQVENDDGTTGLEMQDVPVIQDIPCRISFEKADASHNGKDDSNPIYMDLKIFCAPEHDIEKGDTLVVRRISDIGEVMHIYKGIASLATVYPSHKEIGLTQVGDA